MNDVYAYIDLHNNTRAPFDKLQRIDKLQVQEDNKRATNFPMRETPQQMILKALDLRGAITRQDVQHLLGVRQTTAGRILKHMVEEGWLTKAGKGKNTVYYKR